MNHECLSILWFSLKGENMHLSDILLKPELKEFLHPGEMELLRRIMNIAKEYHKIEMFIDTVYKKHALARTEVSGGTGPGGNSCHSVGDKDGSESVLSVDETSGNENDDQSEPAQREQLRYGMYLIAFCSGVSLVLQEYLEEIFHLENIFLVNKEFSLAYTLATVEKYRTLFSTLNSIITSIQIEGVYGCLLIGRLHKYIDCGITPIEKASRQIVLSVNKMFYNQLANWIICGDIRDIYEEFFIADCNCDDEDFLYEWEMGRNVETTQQHGNMKSPTLKASYKVEKFMLRANLLPSVMLYESAESILFMGRIVWILQNDPRKDDHHISPNLRNDIWSGKQMTYISEIQAMEEEPFDRSRFEKKMDGYRAVLTKYLWSIMVVEANLLEHLQMIRDYYCLGRGELFQQFIVSAEEHLQELPDNYIIKNMNYVFIETARKIYSNNDDSYTKFQLVMPFHMSFDEYAQNPLGNVEMYFEVTWPLHIIFRPKVITLFNKVFNFLMRVKKTHIDLHQLWLRHMGTKLGIDQAVWSLRHNLMFLVNNLQYYLQVDIIEAQFSILIESIKNANEYSDIVRMHSIFVSNLLSRTFVMSLNESDKGQKQFNLLQLPLLDFDMKPKVYNIIICLLELCDTFCLLAANWNPELLAPEQKQLDDIQQNLDTILENLFRALHSLHEKVSGPHLLQLLHRLDFNRWFTKGKPDLNLSVV